MPPMRPRDETTYELSRRAVNCLGLFLFAFGSFIALSAAFVLLAFAVSWWRWGKVGFVLLPWSILPLLGLWVAIVAAYSGARMALSNRGDRIVLTDSEFRQEDWYGRSTVIAWKDVSAATFSADDTYCSLHLRDGSQFDMEAAYLLGANFEPFRRDVLSRIEAIDREQSG